MPTYVYETISEDEAEYDRFEIYQKLCEPALTEHPESGLPVRRVICAPAVVSRLHSKDIAKDNKRLSQLGFTKYEKTGDGKYERTAGTAGPKTFDKSNL